MEKHLAFWMVGTHFLRLSEVTSREIVAAGNPHVIVSDDYVTAAKYTEDTKWSDHSIGIAVLFDFFHGLEVILKGFISLNGGAPRGHRLSDLLNEFDRVFPNTTVGDLIAKQVRAIDDGSPLGRFLNSNGISIDDWYEAFKYPESTKGKPFEHVHLKYGGDAAVGFWKSIGNAARDIRIESVRFADQLEAR